MTMRLLFWILMLLWLIVGLGGPVYWAGGYSGISHIYLGGNLILYLLVGLLGWKVFGRPIEG
jgi:hypothetical protein